MPENPSYKASFMDLPPEIRINIYRHALHNVEIQTHTHLWWSLLGYHPNTIQDRECPVPLRRPMERSAGLLSTNKVIRTEALCILPKEVHLFVSTEYCDDIPTLPSPVSELHWLFRIEKVTWQIGNEVDASKSAAEMNRTFFGREIMTCLEVDCHTKVTMGELTYLEDTGASWSVNIAGGPQLTGDLVGKLIHRDVTRCLHLHT